MPTRLTISRSQNRLEKRTPRMKSGCSLGERRRASRPMGPPSGRLARGGDAMAFHPLLSKAGFDRSRGTGFSQELGAHPGAGAADHLAPVGEAAAEQQPANPA